MAEFQIESNQKLSLIDRLNRRKINKKFKILKDSFANITPKNCIKDLKIYSAFLESSLGEDPPSRTKFVVSRKGIFTDIISALNEIKPNIGNNIKDIAEIIVKFYLLDEGKIIENYIKELPNSFKNKIIPEIKKENDQIIMFSYASRETKNKFVRGYKVLTKYIIEIKNNSYSLKTEELFKELS